MVCSAQRRDLRFKILEHTESVLNDSNTKEQR